jgi:hypothetical protein
MSGKSLLHKLTTCCEGSPCAFAKPIRIELFADRCTHRLCGTMHFPGSSADAHSHNVKAVNLQKNPDAVGRFAKLMKFSAWLQAQIQLARQRPQWCTHCNHGGRDAGVQVRYCPEHRLTCKYSWGRGWTERTRVK